MNVCTNSRIHTHITNIVVHSAHGQVKARTYAQLGRQNVINEARQRIEAVQQWYIHGRRGNS
jgi:hypothetical protein